MRLALYILNCLAALISGGLIAMVVGDALLRDHSGDFIKLHAALVFGVGGLASIPFIASVLTLFYLWRTRGS